MAFVYTYTSARVCEPSFWPFFELSFEPFAYGLPSGLVFAAVSSTVWRKFVRVRNLFAGHTFERFFILSTVVVNKICNWRGQSKFFQVSLYFVCKLSRVLHHLGLGINGLTDNKEEPLTTAKSAGSLRGKYCSQIAALFCFLKASLSFWQVAWVVVGLTGFILLGRPAGSTLHTGRSAHKSGAPSYRVSTLIVGLLCAFPWKRTCQF